MGGIRGKGGHVWQGVHAKGACTAGGGVRSRGSCVAEACMAGEMATATEEYLPKWEVGEPTTFGGNVPIWFVLNKNESYACY